MKRLEYATPCPECERNWCKYLDYFVLGIQLENIFLDRVTIEDLAQGFKGKPDGFNAFVKKSREWLTFNLVREHTKMKGQIMKF